MGRSKRIRKDLAGLEGALRRHQEKIEIERAKPMPDSGRIAHWEAEIRAFRKQIDRLLRRLRRNW